jgi:hypothetical protein
LFHKLIWSPCWRATSWKNLAESKKEDKFNYARSSYVIRDWCVYQNQGLIIEAQRD